jgi:hypothetical protein
MKSLIFIATFFALNIAQADVPALICTGQKGDKLVSSFSPTVLTFWRGEDQGSGTYLTYLSATLTYQPQASKKLDVQVQSASSKIEKVTVKYDTDVEIEVKSRIGKANLVFYISCQPMNSNYLLVPKIPPGAEDQHSDTATETLATYISDIGHNMTFLVNGSWAQTLSENYCVEGDANLLLQELADFKISFSIWGRNSYGEALLPLDLKLVKDGISWQQPVLERKCLISHSEDTVDTDTGLTYPVEVCDKFADNILPSVDLKIPLCMP